MPRVLHRTTKQYLLSADGVDHPQIDWIWDPDLDAVDGFASKYWTITGDIVSLMDQSARDAVDAAELTAQKDSVADELDQVQTIMRAFAEVVLDEINGLRAQHSLAPRTLNQLKTAVRNKL